MNEHTHKFDREAEIEVDDEVEYIVVWEVCECGEHRFCGRYKKASATPAFLALIDAG